MVSRWTIYLLAVSFLALGTLGFKIYQVYSYELSDEYKKQAILDGEIDANLEYASIDNKLVNTIQNSLSLEKYYNSNNK